MMITNMRTITLLLLLLFLLYDFLQAHSAQDTLITGQSIPRTTKVLASAGEKFVLGFFSPLENPSQSYLGIWYNTNRTYPGKTVMVWVANRDNPVLGSNGGGVFQIAQDGNLLVTNESGSTFWSSKLDKSSSNNRTVKLTDSGNLVLFQHDDDGNGTSYIIWQSFQDPTDTFLPGMEIDRSMELTSWRYDGIGGGRESFFTFKMSQTGNNRFRIMDGQNQLHWENDGLNSDDLSPDVLDYLTNFTGAENRRSKYVNTNTSKSLYYLYQDTRIVMNSTGELQFWKWEKSEWIMQWKQPSSICKIHNFCGTFSSCNVHDWMPCKCLPGFRLASEYETQSYEMGMKFPGCVRKSESHGDNRDMVFLNLPNIRLDELDQKEYNTETEAECKFLCFNMSHPQCQAYAYNTSNNYRVVTSSSCQIWTNDLTTLQVDQVAGGDLAVLVKSSDIGRTVACNPCGIYTIPYPLSTGPNCGDPEYYKFNCSYSTGQVSFMMPGGQLKRVTWIDENARKFYIETDDTYHCDYIYQNEKPDPPFDVTNWCFKEDQIEISWQPPLERPCNEPNDCRGFPHSRCMPTIEGKNKCLCDPKYQWNSSISNCMQDEKSKNHLRDRVHLILIVTLAGVIFLASTMVFAYVRRKKVIDRENIQIQESLYDTERHVKALIGLGRLEEKDSKGIEVPFYTFGSIVAATDNFSDSNKLGQGGYGPVYKARFPGGQDIAVKRLSSVSTQGLEEFKNETVLIAKLQHRNLVRLRGYCVKGDEKILLYEYMPNKSLDSFIFDRTRTLLLNWQMRFDIILGIARGLLYLHQDSILRVIHRDLKTSNILLDMDMTPKISDFGLAKIFGGKETEASTERVMGTYGYMAPEYALDGFFSIKSDVFSFGVVILEILSGKKNTGFYQFKQTVTLLGYAWGLWTENRLTDLMDASFSGNCNENQFIKCSQIALLCVQDEPGDRPTMSNVVTMLDSEIATIPIPTQPTFYAVRRTRSTTASSSSKPETTMPSCLARDFLNPGQNITGTTSVLVSAGQRFVLGFFSPAGNPTETYLGIWYYQSQTFSSELPTVVWVANRDKPILNSHVGVFQIAGDGNLVVKDKDGSSSKSYYWSSELEGSSSRNRTVKLMDSGNLVLFQNDENIWQSFQHPTDTFLPGMKMDTTMELTCWSGDSDPRPGNFTFKIMSQTAGDNPRYIILKNNKLYWESSGQNEDLNPDSEFDAVAYFLSNFSSSTKQGNLSPTNYENKRLLMNSTGELQFRTREGFQGDWSFFWKAPQSFCDSYNACGNFSTCKDNNGERCKCLPGFNQVSGSNYCARKSAASSWCGEGIRFLNLVMVKVRNPDIYYTEANESDCKNKCLQMCPKCQAYSYSVPQDTTRRDLSFSTCRIWTHDLITLQEGYFGRNLSVRVDISDIEATPRSCEPCGANIVPYPLSTGRNCGDPLYFTFSCNRSTGDLSFVPTTTSDGYTVISIDADSRKFVIKVTSAETYCNLQTRNDKTLQIHFPFNVTNECRTEDEVEVTWLPPSEPICNESVDCKGWNHSTCEKTGDSNRCLCNSNYRWNNASLNCDSNEAIAIAGGTEQKVRKENSKSQKSLIIGVTLGSVVVLACAVVSAYLCRRKITYKKDKDKIQRNRGRFYDSERHVKDLMEVEGFEEKDHEDIEVPYFDFESILIATDNFSDANKLGRGGYGPVYKGKLQDEVVAVKRLSSISSQGLLEFKNEVVLIAKLQHRNLVRLRGYCIKGEEKILLYEYMPNKSLDSFIFDPKQSVHLDWQIRFDIILGVARGILYLHQDSRLRVIHRDLKTSNILLDKMMQPKISDFGLARIVGGKETETNTERVVGTYGYMSPEYALDGLFSTKSDVFSFGVVLLEIISGKKNTGFYQSSQVPSLLGYAWKLWTENKLIDLMYMSLVESCTENQFIRCAHVALLCVQDEPGDRPSMSSVVTMLDSETSTLPTPKQPTFFASRGQPTTSSSKSTEINMQFESTTHYQEGR
ncbi:uncharacterized protein LOC107612581 [Arachis ipaensis]|uniref:uncharacterized protein LOC107612581 n=1 Tax=Arachis ipaensis TaxID=130454 RepID=UPI000A2B3C9E|nr:uncharacterized protein LOC107612581 [Arachis ipaensis]XP_025669486.1 uncharacterized protein LOC112769248 [Arachis hypogaea]